LRKLVRLTRHLGIESVVVEKREVSDAVLRNLVTRPEPSSYGRPDGTQSNPVQDDNRFCPGTAGILGYVARCRPARIVETRGAKRSCAIG